MKKEQFCILLGGLLGLCPAGMSAQNQFSYQTSWIGNDGGTEATHVPHSMDAMFVREDGMVATITGWDEGGTNVGVWKDGALACRPLDSGTGSWGKNSGQAVVIDDRCVYQLMIFNGNSGNDGLNSNGLRQYPPKTAGVEWQVITRYWIASGTAASFKTGYGPNGNMLLVATQEGRYLTGLALADEKLIVAVPGVPELGLADSIKIYDKDNLTASNQPIGGFRIPEGQAGYLAADDRGYVWMLQRDSNRIVCLDLESGAMRSKLTIDLAADVVAKSFTVDKYNDRILVGNQGKDCNVLIYTNIYDKPELTSTFGVTGGIYVESDKPDGSGKYQKGELGHMRFPGPTGAGVDKYGNIYVSCMYPGTATAALYSYKEATQEFNWKLEGLCFTSTADFDLNDKNLFRTPEKLYRVDYSKLGGRLDEAIASTFAPFTFPREMRNFTSPIVCGVFNRKVQGRDYMFVTDMYSNRLASYRYDPDNYGYIAVPCTEICPDSMWVDKNADGQRSADEMRVFDRRIGTFSNYPDRDGNMWMTDEVVKGSDIHVLYWKVKNVDENGLLQYEEPVSIKLPEEIVEVCRVLYDADRDELLVSCYTQSNPNPNSDIWGRAGSTLLMYDKVQEKLANLATEPSTEWVPVWEMLIPVAEKNEDESAKSIAYTGEYIFVSLTRNGLINVYDRGTQEYLGQIAPGAEVGRQSGWTDITYALNARTNDDGTVELLGEENGFAKVIHYMVDFSPESKIDGGSSSASFRVVPNPASSEVTLTFEGGGEATLSLNTLDGKNVFCQKVCNGETVNVSSLARGSYLLQLAGTANGTMTQKLILY